MASYQADIQIGVKGKAQLNQLEKQLTRVNTAVKQLNKALVLKTRAQTIKLNTKGAMTAVRELENRINRLGRTIDVRLRTTEDRRERSSSSRTGGGGGAVIAVSPQAIRQTASAQKQVTTAYEVQTRELKGLAALEAKRDALGDQRAAQQRELNELIKQQLKLEREINIVENSANEKAATANRNRIFGGRTSKAGNPLSPKQAFRAQEAQLGGVTRRVSALGAELKRTERQYENLNKTSARYYGAERRRAMQATDALERVRKKQQEINETRQRNKGIRNAAGIGFAAAATQIPGLGGVASGALGGAAVAGAPGAIAGGIAGGIADATRALVGFSVESAKFFNQLQLSRKALANTVETTEEYKQALAGIRSIATDFGGGIDNITASYTKLNAAARSSGFTVEEVTEVYRGLAAANTALGGNSERLQGILLATQQVFSKGKVQAEELRGQIGERLAGAFAKFAKSAGLSTSQLDKALEKGEISLKDFQRFAVSLLEEYEDDAKKLYQEPENAAQRLDDAMKDLKAAMGPIVQDLMVLFTNLATTIVTQLTRALNAINNARLSGQQAVVNARFEDLRDRSLSIKEATERNNRKTKGLNVGILREQGLDATINAYNEAAKAWERENRKLERLKTQLGEINPSGKPLEEPLPNEPPKPDEKKSGGGSSKRVRESQLPALQRELALKKQLDVINQKIIEANKVKDSDLVIRLEGEKRLAQIAKSRLDILAEELPPLEKKTKLAINELEAKEAIRATDEQLRQAAQGRQDSIDASIRSLELDAKLAGERNEYARDLLQIEADIVEMRKSSEGFTEKQLQDYKRAALGAAAAREEQRQYNEVLSQVQGPVNALTSGLQDVVAGTKSAEEAFADFLNTIADQLIQTASVMIAQYIAIGIARAFAGIPSGSAPTSPGPINGVQKFGGLGTITTSMLMAADGAFVTGPTPALVGEGGEPEYIIPASKMEGAMARYSSGTRGEAVIDGDGASASGGTEAAGAVIDVNYSVERINNVEYVTNAEFQRGMTAAAKQGAELGRKQVYGDLINKRSVRSRLAI